MKLSNKITTSAILSSVTFLGFSFNSVTANTENLDLVTPEVSQQIVEALGDGDTEELVVDSLTQTEIQLQELGVTEYRPLISDSAEIARLKAARREYISLLRERLSKLQGDDRKEFLDKIQSRRKSVKQELKQIRTQAVEARKQLHEENKAKLEQEKIARQEKFKENLEAKQKKVEERKAPEEKFKERVEQKQQKLSEQEKKSEALKAVEAKEELKKREAVKGAMDERPQGFWDRMGYWLFGR